MGCRDAVIRCGVGTDLLFGATRGRQGFVGSLRWAPLPTLAVLPLLRISPFKGTTYPACVVAAASAALLGALLVRWLARYGVRRGIRISIVLVYFFSAPVTAAILAGSSELLFVVLVAASFCYLLHWVETEQLRSLAYLAICVALALLTRFQAVLLIPICLLFIAGDLALRHKGEAYAEGTLITFLVPAVYAVALWVGANWLIMHDPGFFLRGLPVGDWRWQAWRPLVSEGCEWRAVLAPLAVIGLGWLVGHVFRRRRSLLSGVPAMAACVMLCWLLPAKAFSPDAAGVDRDLADALKFLEDERPDARVVLAGYRGYEVAASAQYPGRRMVAHTLSLYMHDMFVHTRGRHLYLLVPRPEGADSWEDVNLKFPDAFRVGSDFLVFEKDFHHWRLWRVVRIDMPA